MRTTISARTNWCTDEHRSGGRWGGTLNRIVSDRPSLDVPFLKTQTLVGTCLHGRTPQQLLGSGSVEVHAAFLQQKATRWLTLYMQEDGTSLQGEEFHAFLVEKNQDFRSALMFENGAKK